MLTDSKSKLVFDDYTKNDEGFEGESHWTQLCEEHAIHSDPSLQEMPNEGPICGVEGCQNEAKYYYDFNPEENTNG